MDYIQDFFQGKLCILFNKQNKEEVAQVCRILEDNGLNPVSWPCKEKDDSIYDYLSASWSGPYHYCAPLSIVDTYYLTGGNVVSCEKVISASYFVSKCSSKTINITEEEYLFALTGE